MFTAWLRNTWLQCCKMLNSETNGLSYLQYIHHMYDCILIVIINVHTHIHVHAHKCMLPHTYTMCTGGVVIGRVLVLFFVPSSFGCSCDLYWSVDNRKNKMCVCVCACACVCPCVLVCNVNCIPLVYHLMHCFSRALYGSYTGHQISLDYQ